MACLVAGSIEWGDRGAMVRFDSAEAAEQARFAIELYAIGAITLAASIAFFLRRRGWAWWLPLAAQAAALVLGLVEGMRTGDAPGWAFFSMLPLLTTFLLLAFRMARIGTNRQLSAI
jgi:hypothetical protein